LESGPRGRMRVRYLDACTKGFWYTVDLERINEALDA